ncbi:hypothetical protein CBS101457_003247 [Exobasidium rhododendri]|nr:hypothetical protein CBS101457_003247 [Exobasidium rhododendri]
MRFATDLITPLSRSTNYYSMDGISNYGSPVEEHYSGEDERVAPTPFTTKSFFEAIGHADTYGGVQCKLILPEIMKLIDGENEVPAWFIDDYEVAEEEAAWNHGPSSILGVLASRVDDHKEMPGRENRLYGLSHLWLASYYRTKLDVVRKYLERMGVDHDETEWRDGAPRSSYRHWLSKSVRLARGEAQATQGYVQLMHLWTEAYDYRKMETIDRIHADQKEAAEEADNAAFVAAMQSNAQSSVSAVAGR